MPAPFPLQSVLVVREQKLKAEERALMAVNADIQKARATLTRFEEETVRFSAARAKALQEVMTAAHHQMLAMQWRSLQEAQTQLRQRLHALQASRTAQQARMMEARRAHEMLLELRATYQRDLQSRESTAERKRIDDLFSSRHARSSFLRRGDGIAGP